jgi:hypothetical protein
VTMHPARIELAHAVFETCSIMPICRNFVPRAPVRAPAIRSATRDVPSATLLTPGRGLSVCFHQPSWGFPRAGSGFALMPETGDEVIVLIRPVGAEAACLSGQDDVTIDIALRARDARRRGET